MTESIPPSPDHDRKRGLEEDDQTDISGVMEKLRVKRLAVKKDDELQASSSGIPATATAFTIVAANAGENVDDSCDVDTPITETNEKIMTEQHGNSLTENKENVNLDYDHGDETAVASPVMMDHSTIDVIENISNSIKTTTTTENTKSHLKNKNHQQKHSKQRNGNQHVQQQKNNQVSIRALSSAKEAGIIIGKGGKSISNIRSSSEARVLISDQAPNTVERIISVQGNADHVAMAFSLIASSLAADASHPAAATTLSVDQRSVTLKILIVQSRIGLVIGRQGSKVKEIQEISKAKIMVSNEFLPNSTEKAVSVSGIHSAIQSAIYQLSQILYDHPEKEQGNILYNPANPTTVHIIQQQQQQGHQHHHLQQQQKVHQHHQSHPAFVYHHQPALTGAFMAHPSPTAVPFVPLMTPTLSPMIRPATTVDAYFTPTVATATPIYSHGLPTSTLTHHQPLSYTTTGTTNNNGGTPVTHHGGNFYFHHQQPHNHMMNNSNKTSTAAGNLVVQMTVPSEMAGSIIGKGGKQIAEFRMKSGSFIKMSGSVPGNQARLITITGTQESNEMALYLIREHMNTLDTPSSANSIVTT